jgi:hypothetical protein
MTYQTSRPISGWQCGRTAANCRQVPHLKPLATAQQQCCQAIGHDHASRPPQRLDLASQHQVLRHGFCSVLHAGAVSQKDIHVYSVELSLTGMGRCRSRFRMKCGRTLRFLHTAAADMSAHSDYAAHAQRCRSSTECHALHADVRRPASLTRGRGHRHAG